MTMNKDGQCPVCQRLHDIDAPCPKRVARAFMLVSGSWDELTCADIAWMKAHSTINIVDLLEWHFADMM